MILKLGEKGFKREYGILCHRFFPTASQFTPFGSTWCVIEPGGLTAPHSHHEGEIFVITEGAGEMEIDGKKEKVSPGDTIFLPSGSFHVLYNSSKIQPLRFLSVWWNETSGDLAPSKLPKKALVTVAPPTPNGELHLGHLSGPYVAADVHRRFLKMNGVEVTFLTGSDDHQSYVPVKGEALGLDGEAVVTRFVGAIQETFVRAGIEPDRFLLPLRDGAYQEFVRDFVQTLIENGSIVLKEVDEPFCEPCHLFLHEARVSGNCPHCAKPTNGHGCEACGRYNDARDLGKFRCKRCGNAAATKKIDKLFFPLESHREMLANYHRSVAMSTRLRTYCQGLLDSPLPEVSVSFVADWGIPVGADLPGQVIYEWIEMAAGYAYGAPELLRSRDVAFTKFFGFDNSFFYTTLVPALLSAYDSTLALPTAFASNEFYQLEGSKFSTSRNHAVWANDILEAVPADLIRFHLSLTRPETAETEFSLEALESTAKFLAGSLDEWIRSLDSRLAALNRTVPQFSWDVVRHRDFVVETQRTAREIFAHYSAETFSSELAAKCIHRLIEAGLRFSRSESRHSGMNAVAAELTALKALALVGHPLMPQFSERILTALGEASPKMPSWELEPGPLPVGRKVKPLGNDAFAGALAQVRAYRERKK